MKRTLAIAAFALPCFLLFALAMPELNLSGTWVLDKARSFSNPAGLEQTLTIVHNGDNVKLDARLKTDQAGDQAIQESWILDGQERDYLPDGAKPGTKAIRKAYWLPGKRGVILVEERTTPGPNGPVLQRTTRKYSLSADGATLTVDYFSDSPRGQSEAKRVFLRLNSPTPGS